MEGLPTVAGARRLIAPSLPDIISPYLAHDSVFSLITLNWDWYYKPISPATPWWKGTSLLSLLISKSRIVLVTY